MLTFTVTCVKGKVGDSTVPFFQVRLPGAAASSTYVCDGDDWYFIDYCPIPEVTNLDDEDEIDSKLEMGSMDYAIMTQIYDSFSGVFFPCTRTVTVDIQAGEDDGTFRDELAGD